MEDRRPVTERLNVLAQRILSPRVTEQEKNTARQQFLTLYPWLLAERDHQSRFGKDADIVQEIKDAHDVLGDELFLHLADKAEKEGRNSKPAGKGR